MANQFETISGNLAQLKNFYQGPIVDSFNEDIPIARAAEKVKQGWSGYQVVRPVRTVRNQGIGATSDGGSLPSIGKQTTVQALISAKYNYLRFGVTGPMISASKSDAGSFARVASFEMSQGLNDLKVDVDRQLGWDGTADLALVNTTAAASNTIVIKGRETGDAALKFVDIGMAIDIYTGSTLNVSNVVINSISSGSPTSTTATLVLSQPVTVTAADIIVRSGAGTSNEIQGLLTELDGGTTTVFNIDRSTALSFQGNVSDVSSNANPQLTLAMMRTIYNQALRRGGKKINSVYTNFESAAMYEKLLVADKRYIGKVKGDGSFGKEDELYLDYSGIPMVCDQTAPFRFFFLPADVLKLYVLEEFQWVDDTGSYMIAQTSADSFEVRLRYFANLFNEMPSACAVLTGYTSP